MNSREPYKACAPYYRCIASGRDHFESQTRVVKELISRYRLESPKILDAACGSGEVLELLLREGFDAFGSDGSAEMLSLAREIPFLRDNPKLQPACLWQDLASFSSEQQFDLVFILGHAFPHLASSEIPKVIKAVFMKLNPNGLFAFDMRQWSRDISGQLREPNRPIGVRRWKGEFEVNGRQFLLDDCCTYDGAVQRITYDIQHLRREDDQHNCSFTLEYSLFDTEDVKQWFADSEFSGNVEFFLPGKWPYIVVVARKRAG